MFQTLTYLLISKAELCFESVVSKKQMESEEFFENPNLLNLVNNTISVDVV